MMNSHLVQLIVIRHAESQYNQKAKQLRQDLGIGSTWEEAKRSPQFLKFKYSQSVMDCSLSQKGIQQCQKLKSSEEMQNLKKSDIVLVSPLYRTLKTCSILFGDNYDKKIIVEPILSESLRCSCDVSFKLFKAMEQFKNFQYCKIKGKQKQWYIQNQQQEKQKVYKAQLLKNNATNYKDYAHTIVKYMGETFNFEDSYDLIKRMQKAKQVLKEYAISNKAKKIVVISHFYSIQYLISSKFDQKGKPIPYNNIPNAQPLYYKMDLNLSTQHPEFIKQNM